MPTCPLPSDPSLVQLRKQARELQRRLLSGDAAAAALVAEHHPGAPPGDASLHTAQLTVARQYRFPSWPRLVAHLGVLADISRAPDVDPPGANASDRFLTHAVLRYGGDDGSTRWAVSRQLCAADRTIGRTDIYTAATTADHVALQEFLLKDPTLANRQGGPLDWEPLLYLAYSRFDPNVPEHDVVATAALLLSGGADPNAGFAWHGLPTPFTVLTGVFGSGEQGRSQQPHHPHAMALARVLLEAGADPNDGQGLYNRMFDPDDSHLELLFDYGLGTGDGGPWHRRMPEVTDSPTQLVSAQLSWAVSHGMIDRINLLAARGADLDAPLHGHSPLARLITPTELALISGLPHVASLLAELGAQPAEVDAGTRLVGALLCGDAAQADLLLAPDPGLLDRLRTRHPGLILRAAAAGSPAGVRLLLDRGFDVNALARHDLPIDQEWETALHYAAGEGDLELARMLLSAGADPRIKDRRFQATPLGWAENFEQEPMIELLRGVTTPD